MKRGSLPPANGAILANLVPRGLHQHVPHDSLHNMLAELNLWRRDLMLVSAKTQTRESFMAEQNEINTFRLKSYFNALDRIIVLDSNFRQKIGQYAENRTGWQAC